MSLRAYRSHLAESIAGLELLLSRFDITPEMERERLAELRELGAAIDSLDTWVATYAHELCENCRP
jgi:hypothetical protein